MKCKICKTKIKKGKYCELCGIDTEIDSLVSRYEKTHLRSDDLKIMPDSFENEYF
jgi:hypothetical protein